MNPALHAATGAVSSGAGGVQDGNTGAVFHQAAIAAEALSQQQHQHTPHEPGHEDPQQQRASPHAGHASSAAVNANKKRRASGQPGSRGVANLTPEQLAKKRANDREAQRAIRERTKSTIDTLERRISELESQQPFQELQRVKQERDRALAECEELRRRLGVVRDVIGGSQPPGLNELANLTAQQLPLPPIAESLQQPQQPPSQAFTPNMQAQMTYDQQQQQQQHLHPDLRSPHQSNAVKHLPQPTSIGSPSTYQRAEVLPARQWQAYGDSSRPPSQRSSERPPDERTISPHGAYAGYHSHRPSIDHTPDLSHRQAQVPQQPQHHQQQHTPQSIGSPSVMYYQHAASLPIYARLTNIGEPSCPLDSILDDFRRSRRKIFDNGGSMADAIGPETPAYFLYKQTNPPQRYGAHPVSTMLVDILSKFPDIKTLPDQVGTFYLMFLLIRWHICPCAPCYDRLPEWYRPTKEQYETPHPIWLDYIHWPFMRSQLSFDQKLAHFEDFFVPFTTTISVNWPYSPESALLEVPASPQRPNDPPTVVINPAFEQHCRILENWSLGSKFKKTFPALANESVRIEDSKAV